MAADLNNEALTTEHIPRETDLNSSHQRLVRTPEDRIKWWTLICLILNRSIGSGIFLSPGRVLAGTGCVGGALFIWALAAIISICGLYVWLECGLSMPVRKIRLESGETQYQGVPRSGGDKNYLEFMFPNPDKNPRLPHLRTTCSYAIMFILMYNLSANAIAFALQVMTASGSYDPTTGDVPSHGVTVAIAIAIQSLVIALHTMSRRCGIWINDCFAIFKISLLLAIIALGIASAAGAFGGSGTVARQNFSHEVWATDRSEVGSWCNSLLLCIFSFSGWKQPFYILAETESPRKYFPRCTVAAFALLAVLFLLVNISFLLVVDKNAILPNSTSDGLPRNLDMATLFFNTLFDNDPKAARAMAALIAVSIFGNLWVMTFTAARVKQEIAKEGILPFSLKIATSYKTPLGLIQQWWSKRAASERVIEDKDVEHAPTAAFGLHWVSSMILIAVGAAFSDPRKAYYLLASLYTYTVVVLLGFWLSVGLLMIKYRKEVWEWKKPRQRYQPWLSPMHVIVYAVANAFLLIGIFLPLQRGSPFDESVTKLPWYVVPAIGITSPFWGFLWYWGFNLREKKRKRHLFVSRQAYWARDSLCGDEYVQQAELVAHVEQITLNPGMDDKFSNRAARSHDSDSDDTGDMDSGRHDPLHGNTDDTGPTAARVPLSTTFGA